MIEAQVCSVMEPLLNVQSVLTIYKARLIRIQEAIDVSLRNRWISIIPTLKDVTSSLFNDTSSSARSKSNASPEGTKKSVIWEPRGAQ